MVTQRSPQQRMDGTGFYGFIGFGGTYKFDKQLSYLGCRAPYVVSPVIFTETSR